MAGLLIAFSGLDGAGKSTQIERLTVRLRDGRQQPVTLWTRGGYTPFFNALKNGVRRIGRGSVLPESGHSQQRNQSFTNPQVRRLWLILAIFDLIWVYGVYVRWRCWRGRIVICDRYLWDTLIDFRLNFPQEHVERWWLWRLLKWVTPKPDVSWALLISVEESLRRSKQKNEPFPDLPQILEQRLSQYEGLTPIAGWQVLDGRQPLEELATRIWTEVAVHGQISNVGSA